MDILLIFVKKPVLGKVKTRLAQTVGAPEALRIYKILLEMTKTAVLQVPAQRWLFYSEAPPSKRDGWQARFFSKKTQLQSPDLGQRMEAAFKEAFHAGAQRAVIIGSDCPKISPEILLAAFAALEKNDLVVGPASDGGYYLLGMKHLRSAVFQNIEWSTPTVLSRTLEICQQAGWSVALLPTLLDVDTEADWVEFLEDFTT